jgi:hypothetical protein
VKPKVGIKCEADKCVLVTDVKDEIPGGPSLAGEFGVEKKRVEEKIEELEVGVNEKALKVKTEEENFQVESMYTTLSEAKAEIQRRWNDKELRKKVEDYLGEIPKVLKSDPVAVLARHITTPNNEFQYFYDLSCAINLKPLIWEYQSDKFYTVNLDKYCLAKLHFCNDDNSNIISEKIIDFKGIEGTQIKDIKTLWGENLVDFHRKITDNLNFNNVTSFDASDWYKSKGSNSKENYKYFLALFVQNAVLFENFLENDNEKSFTRNVVMPSFKEIEKLFGVKPLIVPISSKRDATEMYWWCYSSDLQYLLKNK